MIAEKFLCAITLSGAAEEILGKLVEQKQGMAANNESVKKVRDVEKKTNLNFSGGRSDTEIIREWNQTRNSLKHLVSPDEDSISINLCDGAYWMIKRALANAERLCLSVENKVEFENWVIMKINI